MSRFSAYGSPGHRFDEATRHSHISPVLLEELAGPQRVVERRFPVLTDTGDTEFLSSIRISYNDHRGPTKGGVRFVPQIRREDLLSLSFLMMVKCAVNGLPHGGAAGAVEIDPSTRSNTELERVARAYVAAHYEWLGQDRDILSPDQNTNATLMAAMSSEFDRLAGRSVPGAINGKPPHLLGSEGRHGATALGAYCVLDEFLRARSLSLDGKRVVLQGFGNAGGTLALELHRRGAKVQGICDSQIGLYSEKGLDIPALLQRCDASRKTNVRTIRDHGACEVRPEELFGLECDIFVPAAVSNHLTVEMAQMLRTGLVLEIANGCTAFAAEKILQDRGIEILPDIIANAGGVTVSHFEWEQNRRAERWTGDVVRQRLEEKMRQTAKELLSISDELNQPLPIAAHILALRRLQ